MKHPIVICGYGPGISHAVAQLFGWAGHPVAIIAHNAHRLADGVAALEAEGIKVQAFMADLSNVKEVQRTIADVRAAMGSIGILHWNAYTNIEGIGKHGLWFNNTVIIIDSFTCYAGDFYVVKDLTTEKTLNINIWEDDAKEFLKTVK